MAITMQDVIDRARVPLNDSAKARFSDAVLLGYANDALFILRTRRPDLYFGTYTTLSPLVVGDDLPINNHYLPHVADYVTARASTLDAEFTEDSRATLFFQLFERGVS